MKRLASKHNLNLAASVMLASLMILSTIAWPFSHYRSVDSGYSLHGYLTWVGIDRGSLNLVRWTWSQAGWYFHYSTSGGFPSWDDATYCAWGFGFEPKLYGDPREGWFVIVPIWTVLLFSTIGFVFSWRRGRRLTAKGFPIEVHPKGTQTAEQKQMKR